MARERITITVNKDLLAAVDRTVDGATVRNRSHAMEMALAKVFLKRPAKALILAGGREIRLPQAAGELPKAMLPVQGRPLLEHMLLRLKLAEVEQVVVSLGPGGQKIKDYFRSGSRFGLDISYLEQIGLKRGTAQPLKQAQSQLMDGSFFLLYGDVLADIDFADFLEFHQSQPHLPATMALASAPQANFWGMARLVGSRVAQFEEKPKNPSSQSQLVNAGLYVMTPAIFHYITPEMQKIESELLPRLAEESRLGGYSFGGDWYDVSTPAAYEQVSRQWRGL